MGNFFATLKREYFANLRKFSISPALAQAARTAVLSSSLIYHIIIMRLLAVRGTSVLLTAAKASRKPPQLLAGIASKRDVSLLTPNPKVALVISINTIKLSRDIQFGLGYASLSSRETPRTYATKSANNQAVLNSEILKHCRHKLESCGEAIVKMNTIAPQLQGVSQAIRTSITKSLPTSREQWHTLRTAVSDVRQAENYKSWIMSSFMQLELTWAEIVDTVEAVS